MKQKAVDLSDLDVRPSNNRMRRREEKFMAAAAEGMEYEEGLF